MPKINNFLSGLYLFSAVVGYTGLVWFLISSLNFLITKVIRKNFLASFISSVCILFLFLDFKVYGLFRAHLNKGLIEYFVKESIAAIHMVSYVNYLFLLIGLVVVFALVHTSFHFISKIPAENIKRINKISYLSILFLFLASQFTYMYVDVINYTPIKKWTRHIPWYQPLTAKRFMIKSGIVDSSKIREFELTSNHKDSSIKYNTETSCRPTAVKPNIVWLFIDSWRFDEFSKEITPNLYNWVENKKPDVFLNHHTTGNASIPTIFSIFYGVSSIYQKSFTESGVTPVFIEKLLAEDYQFNIATSWPVDLTSLPKSAFKKIPNLKMNNGTDVASKADQILKKDMLNFLNNRDLNKPYFSFMIFDSVHDYNIPKDYEGPFQPAIENINYLAINSNTDRTPYFNKHKNSVHYVDSLFKGLIDSPLMKDPKRPTIIVVTSDHGEQFNDLKKGFWGHNSNFSRYQLKIPFFIYWDGLKPKAKSATGPISYSHLTTHMDLTHTFLESTFNCDLAEDQTTGTNLYSDQSRLPLLVSNYSRHGVITEDKIYSYRVESGYEIFDHDYNELDDQSVPKEIYEMYLKESTRFYN